MTDLAVHPARAGLCLVLLALMFRVPTVASRPLWYDEAFAVLFSSKGLPAMLTGTVNSDVHPLLYYALLSAWMRMLGESPQAVRGLSVVLGLGIVLMGYGIGRRLLSPTQALASGVLLACLPFQVHYAQEGRMYALLAFLLLGATLAYVLGVQRRRLAPWLLFALLAAASLYTHNLAVLYLVSLAMTAVFLRSRRAILLTLGASLLAILLFSPWLALVPGQLRFIGKGYWINVPGPADVVRTTLLYVGGLPVPEAFLPLLLFFVLLVLAFALLRTLRAAHARLPGWKVGGWLLYMSAAPVVLMYLVSQWFPIYLDRAMLPSGAMLALWLAWAFGQPEGSRLLRRTAALCLVGAVVLGLWGFYTYRGFPYAPFAAINQAIAAGRAEGEVVLHTNKLTAIPAAYEDPALEAHYLSDPPGSGSDTLAPATQRTLGLIAEAEAIQAAGEAPGVWLVVFRREIDEYRAQGDRTHPAISDLEARYDLASESMYGDVLVQHYTAKPR